MQSYSEYVEKVKRGLIEQRENCCLLERKDYTVMIASFFVLTIMTFIVTIFIIRGSYSVYYRHESEYISIIETNCTLISYHVENYTCSINEYEDSLNRICSVNVVYTAGDDIISGSVCANKQQCCWEMSDYNNFDSNCSFVDYYCSISECQDIIVYSEHECYSIAKDYEIGGKCWYMKNDPTLIVLGEYPCYGGSKIIVSISLILLVSLVAGFDLVVLVNIFKHLVRQHRNRLEQYNIGSNYDSDEDEENDDPFDEKEEIHKDQIEMKDITHLRDDDVHSLSIENNETAV